MVCIYGILFKIIQSNNESNGFNNLAVSVLNYFHVEEKAATFLNFAVGSVSFYYHYFREGSMLLSITRY